MTRSPALRELEDVFEELDTLLKNPDVGAELADATDEIAARMTWSGGAAPS
jgi:hypothetical protein